MVYCYVLFLYIYFLANQVATSCVTAAVLIANLLADSEDLILEINEGN